MKAFQFLLSGAVALVLANSPLDAAPPTSGDGQPAGESVGVSVNADDVTLDVRFDRAEYTLDTVIGSTVTITNNTDKTMIFVQGSGANTVPDALRYDLGGFVPLYKPAVMTMDFRMDDLAPGETVTYQCDFVPYIPKDGLPGFSMGRDLAAYKTGEYTPAAIGTTAGTLSFTYFLQGPGATEMTLYDTAGLEENTVSVDMLEVTIAE